MLIRRFARALPSACVAMGILGATPGRATEAAPTYAFVAEIPIAGDTGWDYLSIDPVARRLYVTHGTHIVVLDVDTSKLVGDIADTPGVHGFAIAPDVHRGFSSNGAESKASVVDLESLKTLSKVATGEGPDAILFEPTRGEIYTFNGKGSERSATVISARSAQVVTSIPLAGRPEFAVADPAKARVFVNLEDRNAVAVIDTATHRVTHQWSLSPCDSPTGMALDAGRHRLFIGCGNKLMIMVDSESGRVITSVPVGAHVDANAFDPDLHLAFSSNGEGTVTIAREDSPDSLRVVQTLQTQPTARTMALDPKTHRIFLVAAKTDENENPPPGTRRKMVPGSFKVLVYGPTH